MYSMEWEWRRNVKWTDRKFGNEYGSEDLYQEIKNNISIYMQKEEAKSSKLEEDEVISLRLYTSPGY